MTDRPSIIFCILPSAYTSALLLSSYIQTAIFSTSFCVSAKAAFWLIARNLLRVGAVSLITEYILIIMKLVISLGVAALAYYGMKHMVSDDWNHEIFPLSDSSKSCTSPLIHCFTK